MTELTATQKKNLKELRARKRRVVITAPFRSEKVGKDDVLCVTSFMRETDPKDQSVFDHNELVISVGKDGHLDVHDDLVENFTYFYPQQLDILAAALRKAREMAKANDQKRHRS